MNYIRKIVNENPGYIVGSACGKDEYLLAYELKLPLYSGDPIQAKSLMSKIESKLFLNFCGLPTAPGLVV